MYDESEYLRRAELFEALAEKSRHKDLKLLYRQLAADYRNLAAAIEGAPKTSPQPKTVRNVP
jgi:hypothetical protein